VGESGLSRTGAKAPSVVWAKVQTRVLQNQCSGPGAARQSRSVCVKAGSDDPASRNERAEGLWSQQETNCLRLVARVSLAGSMRPEAVARESGHLWRWTDDERSWCAFGVPERPAEVFVTNSLEFAVQESPVGKPDEGNERLNDGGVHLAFSWPVSHCLPTLKLMRTSMKCDSPFLCGHYELGVCTEEISARTAQNAKCPCEKASRE